MELDERKQKILYAIIRTYMETGEPVGSRTISKYSDLNLSSATIRNEMSDLEEMGYIIQPHTSAGRIPSDKGYRLYVDHILENKDQEIQEKRQASGLSKSEFVRRALSGVEMSGSAAENRRAMAHICEIQTILNRIRLKTDDTILADLQEEVSSLCRCLL